MRSRNIKPGFFHNDDLVECSFPARILFAGLWCLADRSGYLEDRPKKIKIQIFPADAVDCDGLLRELKDAKLIKRYETDNGQCIWIPGFRTHQNPHRREKPSTIQPHPDDAERGAVPEPERTGGGQDKDRPRTDQGQTQSDKGADPARLIPDPLSLIPDSGFLNKETLSDESDGKQPETSEEPFYLTAKKKKLKGKRLETFDQFWDAFNYKSARAQAADAWLAIPELKPSIVDLIIKAAEAEAKGRPGRIAAGSTPKMAQGWINARRWEDETFAVPNTPSKNKINNIEGIEYGKAGSF